MRVSCWRGRPAGCCWFLRTPAPRCPGTLSFSAPRCPPLDAAHARRQVHAATEEAIEALIELDLARERPEMADTLNDLLTAVVDPRLVPPWLERRDRELLERSLRLAGMCELALDDDGAATTALQAQRRADVLRPLLAVARHGAAAATRVVGPVEGGRATRWRIGGVAEPGTDPAQPWARTQL